LAAQAEAEAEKRVAHLQQAAARRMMQAGLTRGWQSWLDVYLERQRSMRMLAAAAGRLARPALTAALTHWRADWQEEQQRMLEEGQELLLAEQARRDEKSHAELEVLRAELQKARDDHQTEKRVWEEQLGTHARTAEETMQAQLLEQLEAQQELRMAHLQQMAAKRMMQAGLTKCWTSWLDVYLERQASMRMLAAAAGRLARPALAACLVAWRTDWQQAQAAAIEAAYELRAREKDEAQAKALAMQAEAEREKRIAHVQQKAAKRMMQAGLTKGWQTWMDMYREDQRQKRMLAAAAGRLARPALTAALTHWREDFVEEQRAALEEGQRLLRAEAEGRTAEQQAEIDELRAEVERVTALHEELLGKAQLGS
jgi:hypothetical protein